MSPKQLPNSYQLSGLPCISCQEGVCTIVHVRRREFIAICNECRYATKPTPRIYNLFHDFAFGEAPIEAEK